MWLPKANAAKKETGSGSVAVAIDKDKGSQHALKWTIDNLASRGQTISLIHVLSKSNSTSGPNNEISAHLRFLLYHGKFEIFAFAVAELEEGSPMQRQQSEKVAKDLFVSFHCYCSRKEVINIFIQNQVT